MSTQNDFWYVGEDPWVISQNKYEPEKNIYFETIMSQANGYMGVRAYTEENTNISSVREGYLAGIFAELEGKPKEIVGKYPWPTVEMVSLPTIFACDILLEGEGFKLSEGKILSYKQALDMRNGLLTREITWESCSGKISKLIFERFLSIANPHLAVQRIRIVPENWEGKVQFQFGFNAEEPTLFRCGDTAMPHYPTKHFEVKNFQIEEAVGTVEIQTNGTRHKIAISSAVNGTEVKTISTKDTYLYQDICKEVKPNMEITIERVITVTTCRDKIEKDVAGTSKKMAQSALNKGFDTLIKESSECWSEYWATSDIIIEGPIKDQVLVRFNLFSLLQIAPFHSDRLSIPARGYSFNRYNGLYYWDSEIFMLPFYLYTVPEVASNLLAFRHHTLEGARESAKRLNGKGAAFPWMTDVTGLEQAPWKIGDYVWHQIADIAYAVEHYYKVTGDLTFMYERGVEIFIETARFWISKIEKHRDGSCHLLNTVGPDESSQRGIDNGYTNLMVQYNLKLAVEWTTRMQNESSDLYKALEERLSIKANEISQWENTAETLCSPEVPELGIPLQDEFLLHKKEADIIGWNLRDDASKWKVITSIKQREEYKVIKQADIILAMYLLQHQFTEDQLRKAYDFYEPMTIHISSLSYNTHAIIAAKIGKKEQAYEYFINAARLDMDNIKNATNDGLHSASNGGVWQSVVMGFAGMNVTEDGFTFTPCLPALWKLLKFHIVYHGKTYSVKIYNDDNRVECQCIDSYRRNSCKSIKY